MGLLDFFSDIKDSISVAFYIVKLTVEEVVDSIKDFFSFDYDKDDIGSRVNADSAFASFLDQMDQPIEKTENVCKDRMCKMFEELGELINEKYPDLSDLVMEERERANDVLSGEIRRYIREHFSQNDEIIQSILNNFSGTERNKKLESEFNNTLEKAEKYFNKKLRAYSNGIIAEVKKRLDLRMNEEEKRINNKIEELEALEKEMKEDSVDIKDIVNEYKSMIEASQCINVLLQEFE